MALEAGWRQLVGKKSSSGVGLKAAPSLRYNKLMLPASIRLAYKDSHKVLRLGKSVRTDTLIGFILKAEKSRWQILIPKKTLRLAVARNRSKRLLGEAVVYFNSQIKQPAWFVIKQTRVFGADTLIETKQQLASWLVKAQLI